MTFFGLNPAEEKRSSPTEKEAGENSRGNGLDFTVTPWVVEGKVDYTRLIEEFGTEKITENLIKRLEELTGESSYLLRRGIFFSHRDLDLVLDDYEEKRGFFLYTGRGPSGAMHIGHVIPFYFTRWLQERLGLNVYVQITDDEKFLEERRGLSLEETKRWAQENTLDIAATGFDPDKTFIFQNTEYIKHIYSMALRVAKKINLSVARATFGYGGQTNLGMLFYPAVQAVPAFFERKRCLIPAAVDQDPYWRLQRDLAESMGYFKAATIHSKFLPPLTGFSGKMSSSRPETAIYLHDDTKTVRDKIFKHAFSGGQPTVELHRKLGGNPDVDVAFQWLYMFFEEDEKRIRQIREDYRSGKLLTGELKEILVAKIQNFLVSHRERKEKAKELMPLFKREGMLAREMWAKNYE